MKAGVEKKGESRNKTLDISTHMMLISRAVYRSEESDQKKTDTILSSYNIVSNRVPISKTPQILILNLSGSLNLCKLQTVSQLAFLDHVVTRYRNIERGACKKKMFNVYLF